MFNLVLTILIVIFIVTSIITGMWHLTRYLKYIVMVFIFLVLMVIVGKAVFNKSNFMALHKQVEKADIGGVAQKALKTTAGNLSDKQPVVAPLTTPAQQTPVAVQQTPVTVQQTPVAVQQTPAAATQSTQIAPKQQPTEFLQNRGNHPSRQAAGKKVERVQKDTPAVQPATTGKKKSVFEEFDEMKVDGFDD